MKSFLVLLIALASANVTQAASAACSRPLEIRSADEARSAYLLLKAYGVLFLLDRECAQVQRSETGVILRMSILNRFPELSSQAAIVRIKSVRTFSTEVQTRRIKVSRGDGFFLPETNRGARTVYRIDDVPLNVSVAQWNTVHASDVTPQQTHDPLGEVWHAYAISDFRLPSTNSVDFWKLPESIEQSRVLVTAYLLRFDVNTGETPSEIPFKVYAQRGVTKIELELDSNIEALIGKYTININ